MRRLLLCLPLVLVLAPDVPPRVVPDGGDHYCAPHFAGAATAIDSATCLPDNAKMEQLARTNPIAFLENCILRCDRDVQGYHAELHKHERVGNDLHAPEVIDIDFREHPFSFRMIWKQGMTRASRSLYVEGEYGNKVVIRPEGLAGALGSISLDPNGALVKSSSRYPPEEFGMKIGTEKTLAAWKNARKHGDLKVEFIGTERVERAGNRECWVLERTNYVRREEDGITRSRFYFDTQTWLQVGSVLWRDDQLLGSFFFRDVKINPEFPPETFTRKGI
jgi:Protein of unknown function (DUF1571)